MSNYYGFNEIETIYNKVEVILSGINCCCHSDNNYYISNVTKYIKEIFEFARVQYEETNYLRDIINKNDIFINDLHVENTELNDKLVQIENTLHENERKVEELVRNAVSIYKLDYEEIIEKLKNEKMRLQLEVKEFNNKIKIVEIEKEELCVKCDMLEESMAKDSHKIKELNKALRSKDNDIDDLKMKLEKAVEENSQISQYYSTNYSSTPKKDKHIEYTLESESPGGYENYLSSICPDFETDDTGHDNVYEIKLTPIDIVNKMSPTKKSPEKITANPADTDIYKDFFMLTFQAVKINTKLNSSLNPEELYKYILAKRIPFHKVYLANF
jgi:hypothetical protein